METKTLILFGIVYWFIWLLFLVGGAAVIAFLFDSPVTIVAGMVYGMFLGFVGMMVWLSIVS